MPVFDQLTANGQTSDVQVPAGIHTFSVAGDFGGGTVVLQLKDPLGNWIDVADTSFTNDGQINIHLGGARPGRLKLTGASSPSINGYVG